MGKASRQQAFDREFRGHIERLTPKLVSSLRAITGKKPPAEVKLLCFEVQSSWDTFPVNAFAMSDESPDEVYFKPPFSGRVLKSAGPLVPPGAIDQDGYEAAGVDTFERGARLLCEGFGKCWDSAGGKAFPIPAYIRHHDRSPHYDLRSKRWVMESAIWS